MEEFLITLWIRILQELWIKLEDRILAIVIPKLMPVSCASPDALEPFCNVGVILVVDYSCIRQQDYDVDCEVCKPRVIVIIEVDEPYIQIAVEGIAVKEKAEVIVLSEEVVFVRFHEFYPFILWKLRQ